MAMVSHNGNIMRHGTRSALRPVGIPPVGIHSGTHPVYDMQRRWNYGETSYRRGRDWLWGEGLAYVLDVWARLWARTVLYGNWAGGLGLLRKLYSRPIKRRS